jgi:hypothetical protein
MELIITVLCILALAALAAQLFNPLMSIPGLAQHLPYFGRPDSSAGSVPSVSSDGYDPATMFRRMDSLTEASNAATMASRRLAEQGGVATSIEQQYLLQQPYN